MLCAKYDYDLDIQVKQEEAFALGWNKVQEIRKEELGIRKYEVWSMREEVGSMKDGRTRWFY